MINLEFARLRSDRQRFRDQLEVQVAITADIQLSDDDGLIYEEVDFPVIELALHLSEWLRNGEPNGLDFEFDSMETPETGWIWIRRYNTGWRLGSIHQERPAITVHSSNDMATGLNEFIARLRRAVHDKFGLDFEQRG